MKTLYDHNLKAHNTFGISATCRRYIEIDTAEELQSLLRGEADGLQPYIIIGAGSNLLLTTDYPGTVVRSAIKGYEPRTASSGDVYIRVGSGETWDDFVAYCVAHRWHGAENLSAIPGDVGASAVQNIGAYGVEAAQLIHTVEAIDMTSGQRAEFARDQLDYGYRQSRFKREWKGKYLITHVTYKLSTRYAPSLDYAGIRERLAQMQHATPTAAELRSIIIAIRRDKLPDPQHEGNAGSFFMNPVVERSQFDRLIAAHQTMPHYYVSDASEKIPAAWLIEQCGWKGQTMGRAGVHAKQPLVLVNRGGATGAEILALAEAIRRDVKHQFGIDIQPEVNIV